MTENMKAAAFRCEVLNVILIYLSIFNAKLKWLQTLQAVFFLLHTIHTIEEL